MLPGLEEMKRRRKNKNLVVALLSTIRFSTPLHFCLFHSRYVTPSLSLMLPDFRPLSGPSTLPLKFRCWHIHCFVILVFTSVVVSFCAVVVPLSSFYIHSSHQVHLDIYKYTDIRHDDASCISPTYWKSVFASSFRHLPSIPAS